MHPPGEITIVNGNFERYRLLNPEFGCILRVVVLLAGVTGTGHGAERREARHDERLCVRLGQRRRDDQRQGVPALRVRVDGPSVHRRRASRLPRSGRQRRQLRRAEGAPRLTRLLA